MNRILGRREWLKNGAVAAAFPLMRVPRVRPAVDPQGKDEIWLDENENPFGIPPRAEAAMAGSIRLSNRYPEDAYTELRKLISEREGVPENHILLGAGSTEILSLAVIVHGSSGRGVLMADPGYFDFRNYATNTKSKLTLVPLNDRYEHDLAAFDRRVTRNTGLVYICNPNNPTGTIVAGAALRDFCSEASRRSLVLVDEAYFELADDPRHASMIDLVKKGANLVVTRTFSKIYGLAGLRIGYGIGRPEVIESLGKVQTNFAPVSSLSLQAAVAGYRDAEFVQSCKRRFAESKSFFCSELEKLQYPYVRSQASFVIFQVAGKPREVSDGLAKQHIHVRPFEFFGRGWIRASMGTMQEMRILTAALRKR